MAVSKDLRAEIAAHEQTKRQNQTLLHLMSTVVSQLGVDDELFLDEYTVKFKDGNLLVGSNKEVVIPTAED